MEADETYTQITQISATHPGAAQYVKLDDAIFAARLTPGRISNALIICVWIWSMIEAPLELTAETQMSQVAALVVAKLLFSAVALLALRRSYLGLVVFTFSCAMSVLAISFTLPMEYSAWRTAFYVSLAECVLKLGAVVALSINYLYER
jgi:hypothetical protein